MAKNPGKSSENPPAQHSQTPDGPMSSVMDPVRVSANVAGDYDICVKLLEDAKEFSEPTLNANVRRVLSNLAELRDTDAKLEAAQKQIRTMAETIDGLEAKLDKQSAMKQMRVGRSSSRAEFVTTGAIVLSDGTRMCLRHIGSYRLGHESILFFDAGGKQIGTWTPPVGLMPPQAKKGRLSVLAALDDIFAVVVDGE